MGMADTNISNLPDCVIQYILSFLPSKDAVRTSILAKRWKYFWSFLTVLDLIVPPPLFHTLDFAIGIRFPLLKTLNLTRVTFENENSAQLLFSACPVLQELTLYNCYWLNIQQITIAIATLRILTFHSGPGHIYLNNYDDHCVLKVNAVNLVSLSYTSREIVELLPVNLTSVVDAYIDRYHRRTANPQNPLYAADCAFQLLSGLSSVKSLRLRNETLRLLGAKDTLHLLPPFHNLTHLHVLSGKGLYTSGTLKNILSKTPKLEVLQIRTGLDGEIWTLNSMPSCFKVSLKVVCISDFYGVEDQIELVRFLLENATTLREIKIFWLKCIISNLEEVEHIKNQLQPSPLSSCVITFQ